MDKNKICPVCRFPKRISGHVFITKDMDDYIFIQQSRCRLCKHLPDYVILNTNKLQARIIYRNFTNSGEYFEKVKQYLKENSVEIITTQSD